MKWPSPDYAYWAVCQGAHSLIRLQKNVYSVANSQTRLGLRLGWIKTQKQSPGLRVSALVLSRWVRLRHVRNQAIRGRDCFACLNIKR